MTWREARPKASEKPYRWYLQLICCGRVEGYQLTETWEEADDFRRSFCAAEGHNRSAILKEMPREQYLNSGQRIGRG